MPRLDGFTSFEPVNIAERQRDKPLCRLVIAVQNVTHGFRIAGERFRLVLLRFHLVERQDWLFREAVPDFQNPNSAANPRMAPQRFVMQGERRGQPERRLNVAAASPHIQLSGQR